MQFYVVKIFWKKKEINNLKHKNQQTEGERKNVTSNLYTLNAVYEIKSNAVT